jgi:hypothetical protein
MLNLTSRNMASERGRLVRMPSNLASTQRIAKISLTNQRPAGSTAAAFTLVELLAVIATLIVLGAVLLPAFARTAPNTQAFQCLGNLKQLIAGWQMYAADNQDWLVYNTDGGETGERGEGGNPDGIYGSSWVGGWLTFGISSDNTDTNLLVTHDLNLDAEYGLCGFLGAYVKDPALWKCPADKVQVRNSMTGQLAYRVRSYSMNNFVGSLTRTWLGEHAGPGVTLGQREGASRFSIYEKYSRIPSPATVFVILDENPAGINDGDFESDPDAPYQMIDFPTGNHCGSGVLSFADGHVEAHKWVDPRTAPLLPPGVPMELNLNLPGDADVTWLQQHATGTQ